MATKLTSRQELIDYCLRRLGHPVVEINVDDDQIDDRINDGLALFREYVADGSKRIYQPIQITSTHISQGFVNIETEVAALSGRVLDVVSSVAQALKNKRETIKTFFIIKLYILCD